MPRKEIKATAREVQKARAEWYSFHYENRQKVKHFDNEKMQTYQYTASMIMPARMTIYGGVADDWPERKAYELAGQYKLDVNLINHWYLSEAGWEEFQRQWQQLPEPVDLYPGPCVQVGDLYPLYTMPAEAEPPK